MVSLKDLGRRIVSVKSTQKITRSMQLISASRLHQTKTKLTNAIYYILGIRALLRGALSDFEINLQKCIWNNDIKKWEEHVIMHDPNVANNTYEYNTCEYNGAAEDTMIEKNICDKTLLIVFSSDRGLCGQFNTALTYITKAEVKRCISESSDKRESIKIFCIGKRCYDSLKADNDMNVIEDFICEPQVKELDFEDVANNVSQKIYDQMINGNFTKCKVIYTHFVSALKQFVRCVQIFPLSSKSVYTMFTDKTHYHHGPIDDSELMSSDAENMIGRYYMYEPGDISCLFAITKSYYDAILYGVILHNSVSSYSARAMAMDNATTNSKELLKTMERMHNTMRQASITRELLEIIAALG